MANERVYISLLVDPEFLEFLDYLLFEKGVKRSKAVEISIRNQHKDKYNTFLNTLKGVD